MPFIVVVVLIIAGLTSASEKLGITVTQLLIAIGFGILICALIVRKMRLDAKKQAFTLRRTALLKKYGSIPLVDDLMACSVLRGMSVQTLFDSIGIPADEDHKVLKTKVRRTLKYKQTGVNRFDLRVIVEGDQVVGWQTQQPIGTANAFRPVFAGLPGDAYGNDVAILQRKAAGPTAWAVWCAVGIIAFLSAGHVPSPGQQAISASSPDHHSSDTPPSAPTTSGTTNASQTTALSTTPVSEQFDAGRDARTEFETWLKGLLPQQRKGALWWVNERSKKTPRTCTGPSDFVASCSEAKVRLDEADRRRLSDPEYRRGWNSVSSG